MRETSNVQQKAIWVLIVFLFIQPIIDVITSFLVRYTDFSLTIGMIIRIAFLLLAVYYCLFMSKSRYKKYVIWYSVGVVAFSLVYLLYMVSEKNSSVLFLELKSLAKSFYFPMLLLCLIPVLDDQEKSFDPKYIVITVLAYVGLILLAIATGTDFISYGSGKLGTSGWFFAANETGTIVGILFPVVVLYIINALDAACSIKKLITALIIITVYGVISLNIGTKVPMLCILITFGMLLLIHIIRMFISEKKKSSAIISIVSLAMIILTIAVLPYTASGKNLSNHMASVNVHGISDFFGDGTSSDNAGPDPTNVIFSSRDIYLEKTAEEFEKDSALRKILGLGSTVIKDNQIQTYKSIEMDFYTVFYQFGILGFIIYFIPVLIIFARIAFAAIKRCRESIASDITMGYIVGLILSLGIAYIAGHVLTAPAVSVYVALLAACLFISFARKKKAGAPVNEGESI
ncbi:MAG: O-antigen ligase family protein [Bacillota bacterium]